MISAGIQIDDAVANEYTALRMKRSHRYIIMKISDDKTKVEIENLGPRDSTFDAFKDAMPKDRGRYTPFSHNAI